MGTFVIRPTSLSSGGTPFTNSASITIPGWYDTIDANTLLQCLLDPTDVNQLQVGASAISAFSDTIRFRCSGASIYLDGSVTPISFSGLPSGFTITSATVKVDLLAIQNPDVGPLTQFFLQHLAGDNGIANAASFPYSFTFPNPTMLDIINNGMGISVILNSQALTGGAAIVFGYLRIEGNYNSLSYSWTLPVTTGVKAGDQFTINGDPNSVTKLDSIAQIIVKYTDSNNNTHSNTVSFQDFIFQSQTQIIFWFPQFGNISNGTTVYITAVGNGTQFSGSVLLGSVTIIFADSSGIYQLIPGKRTDTIYDRSTPGATKDVNIPDPFIKTALIP